MSIDPTQPLEVTPMVMGKIALEDGIHRVSIGEDDNKLATLVPDLSVKVHLSRSDLARCLECLEVQYGDTFDTTSSAFSPGGSGLDGFNNPNVHVWKSGSSFDLGSLKEHRHGLGANHSHKFWIGHAKAEVDHYAHRSAVISDGTGKEPLKLLKVITGDTAPQYLGRNVASKAHDRFYLKSDGTTLEGDNDPSNREQSVDTNYTYKSTGTAVNYHHVPFNTNHSVSNASTYGGVPEAFIRSISNNFYDITAGDEFALRALTQPSMIQELAGFWFDGCRVRNTSNARYASNFQYMMSGAYYKTGTQIEAGTTTFPDSDYNTVEAGLGYEPASDSVNNPWDSPYGATVLKNVVQKYFNRESGEMDSFDVVTDGQGRTAIRLGAQGLHDKVVTVNLYMLVRASVKKSASTKVSLKSEAIVNGEKLADHVDCNFIPDYSAAAGGVSHQTTDFSNAGGNDENWVLRIKLVFDQSSTEDELNTFAAKVSAKEAEYQSKIDALITEIGADIDTTGSSLYAVYNAKVASEATQQAASDAAQAVYDSNPSSDNLDALNSAKVLLSSATNDKSVAYQSLIGKQDEKSRVIAAKNSLSALASVITTSYVPTAQSLSSAILAQESAYESEISALA